MPKEIQADNLPDAPNVHNYNQVPVSTFGLDMLKKMGYTEEKGIGKRKGLMEPIVLKPRSKRLGLGATEEKTAQETLFKQGEYILIQEGHHKGLTAIIKSVAEDHLIAELIRSHSIIKLKKQQAKVVSKIEAQSVGKKVQLQKNLTNVQNGQWRAQELRQQINNQNIIQKKQEYECILRENGETQFIRGMQERDVQTVVPKIGEIVLIVKSKHQLFGEKATVVKKSKGEVIIQTIKELQMIAVKQNDVCQYVQL